MADRRAELIALLTLLTLLAGAALAGAPELAAAGEHLPGAVVQRVEHHREYERYHLLLDDGRPLAVEVVVEGDSPGVCSAGGLTIFPRWELLGQVIPEPEGRHPAVAALCRRLEAAPAPAAGPPLEAAWGQSLGRARAAALLGVALLLGLLAVIAGWLRAPPARGAAPGHRGTAGALLAITGLSAALRLACSPRGIFNGAMAGYEKLELALHPGAATYGGGWAALMGGAHALLGPEPEVVFGVNLVLASAAPGLLWLLLRALAGARAAWIGALALAALPLHIKLSASEVMHVSLSSLELLALAATAALARRERGGWGLALTAVSAVAWAIWLRPEALPLAALPPIWLALLAGRSTRRPPVLAAALGCALVGAHRAAALLAEPGAGAVIQVGSFAEPGFWLAALTPHLGAPGAGRVNTLLYAGVSPPLLWLAAAGGLALGCDPRRRRAALAAGSWLAALLIPVLPKSTPLADAWRLQLPAQPAAVALAALGLSALAGCLPRRLRWPIALLLPAHLPLYLPWIAARWAHQAEWDWLRAAAPSLRGPAVVLYDGAPARAEHFGAQLQALSPPGVRWLPAGAELPPAPGPVLLYRGVSCQDGASAAPGCAQLWRRCHPQVVDSAALAAHTDLDVRLEGEEVTVGFYRLDCPTGLL